MNDDTIELQEKSSNQSKAEKIWKDYENAKLYQDSIGLTRNVPTYVKMFEGDQWPKPTERTKHLPRPVFNAIEMIVDNKVSNVLGNPVKLNFVADNDNDVTTKFTRFAAYQQKEMGQEALDDRGCLDGAIKGTYIYHYYWDDTACGKKGNYEGALRGQIIDVLNFFVANPKEPDIQKQEWCMFDARVEVERVKQMADEDIDKELITPDDNLSEYNEEEQEGTKLCTLLLRYFKVDGEVYFERAVKGTMVHAPRPINYSLNEESSIKADKGGTGGQPDEDIENISQEEIEIDRYKASVYPIAVGNWKKRDKCIYGRGEVEGLIPNQKAINFEIAMQLLNHQELGWGKILVKPGALNGQKIENVPGEIIVDNTPGNGWGITRMDGQAISAGSLDLVNTILTLTRSCTNSSEVITGEMVTKDLSGTAIAQLQAQSQKPIARLQKNYWKVKEQIGKILEMFYKLYYEDAEFSYELPADEMAKLEIEAQLTKSVMPPKNVNERFNGNDYINTKFNVVVEAGAGTQYSEIMAMDVINSLFVNGAIKNMTSEQLEQYISLMPDSTIPNKAEFRAIIRKQQESELNKYRTLAENYAVQNQQLQEQNQSNEVVIKQLMKEINTQKGYSDKQESEYSKTINTQNQIITNLIQQIMNSNQSKTANESKNNQS